MKRHHQPIKPPKLAQRLLRWFLKEELAEEVMGDLDEKFYGLAESRSIGKARRNYWYQVGKYLRPFAIKKHKYQPANPSAMFKHNLLISYRSFLRSKSTFLINLVGLGSGLACTLLIYLWVADELAIDRFHEKDARLYQVMRNMTMNDGEIVTTSSMPGKLAQELMANFPEVELATMVWPANFFGGEGYLTYEKAQFRAEAQFVDPAFFNMMSFPLIQGNPNTALADQSEVLISESLADRVFGSTRNILGKSIKWNKGRATGEYFISGVFADVPDNSTMQFDLLLNAQIMMEAYSYMEHWGNTNPDALVLLKEESSAEDFVAKIENLMQSKVKSSNSKMFIQRFSDRYLNGSYENGAVAGGRIAYVWLFSMVALMILAIACINFMNLSTAKAAGRLKEIGVKKALGAKRKTLISQYYTESFLLTILSTVLALGTVALLLPQFNQVTGKTLSIHWSAELMMAMVFFVLVTGLLAGSYPALYLSRLKTTASLKGKLAKSLSDLWVRKGLVVFQFSVSIVLIVSVLIISRQINYIQTKSLGYERENVLKFTNTGISKTAFPGFLASLDGIHGVISAAGSTNHNLTGNHGKVWNLNWPGKQSDQKLNFASLEMSPGFIETMGIELVLGRTFDRNRPNEETKIIFNVMAIEQMGLEDPIGKKVKLWGNQEKEIIGVVADFHTESLYERIQPTFIQAFPVNKHTLVKIEGESMQNTLAAIEKQYETFSNGLPFQFRFLDENYQALYESENRVASLAKFFAFVAVIISCLGLLGLTAFTAEKRKKEIGIRKVLGSGSWRIVRMLLLDFTKMVLLALFIGLPISYGLAQSWLADFEFRIGLQLWYFGLAGIIILGIAWFTVGLQTLKAAKSNPVDALRAE